MWEWIHEDPVKVINLHLCQDYLWTSVEAICSLAHRDYPLCLHRNLQSSKHLTSYESELFAPWMMSWSYIKESYLCSIKLVSFEVLDHERLSSLWIAIYESLAYSNGRICLETASLSCRLRGLLQASYEVTILGVMSEGYNLEYWPRRILVYIICWYSWRSTYLDFQVLES